MKVAFPPTLLRFLHRYHLTIFVVVVLGGLAYVIFSLSQTLNTNANQATTPPPTGASQSTVPTLDQATMKKIDSLQPSGTSSAPPDLSGRSNPFAE